MTKLQNTGQLSQMKLAILYFGVILYTPEWSHLIMFLLGFPGESQGRGSLWAAVYEVAKSWTRLIDLTFTFHFRALEKEMATHSSVLAWRIPWTEKPGGLQSMGSRRVRYD